MTGEPRGLAYVLGPDGVKLDGRHRLVGIEILLITKRTANHVLERRL
jgi:hypothetical protein